MIGVACASEVCPALTRNPSRLRRCDLQHIRVHEYQVLIEGTVTPNSIGYGPPIGLGQILTQLLFAAVINAVDARTTLL